MAEVLEEQTQKQETRSNEAQEEMVKLGKLGFLEMDIPDDV